MYTQIDLTDLDSVEESGVALPIIGAVCPGILCGGICAGALCGVIC